MGILENVEGFIREQSLLLMPIKLGDESGVEEEGARYMIRLLKSFDGQPYLHALFTVTELRLKMMHDGEGVPSWDDLMTALDAGLGGAA